MPNIVLEAEKLDSILDKIKVFVIAHPEDTNGEFNEIISALKRLSLAVFHIDEESKGEIKNRLKYLSLMDGAVVLVTERLLSSLLSDPGTEEHKATEEIYRDLETMILSGKVVLPVVVGEVGGSSYNVVFGKRASINLDNKTKKTLESDFTRLLVNRLFGGKIEKDFAGNFCHEYSVDDIENVQELVSAVLSGYENTIGKERPEYWSIEHILAGVDFSMGEYKEAEKLEEHAYAGREKNLASGDIDRVFSFLLLADIKCKLEKYEESKKMYEDILGHCPSALKGRDDLYSRIYHGLGVSCLNLGDSKSALSYLEKAVNLRRNIFGDGNLDTLESLYFAGKSLMNMGNYSKAKDYLKVAADGRFKILGLDDRRTAISYSLLGQTLYKLKQYEDAVSYLQEAVKYMPKFFSSDDRTTIDTYYYLAFSFHYLRRYEESLDPYLKALNGYDKILGPENSLTLCCVENYAFALYYADKDKEAKNQFTRLHDYYEKTEGSNSENTLDWAYWIASCMYYMNDAAGVISYIEEEQVLKLQREKLGESHDKTLRTMKCLANAYAKLHKFYRAKNLFMKIYKIKRKAVGAYSKELIPALEDLVRIYDKMGKGGCKKALNFKATVNIIKEKN